MIKFNVYASGSKGNFYTISDGETKLMLECGIPWKNILQSLEFNISEYSACLISHSHKDHCKSAKDLMKNGIDIYLSRETATELNLSGHRVNIIKALKQFKIGTWTILPFNLNHDVYNLGYLMSNNIGEKFLFITDSYYCEYNFSGVNMIAIECNYSEKILKENIENEIIPVGLAARVTKSHFSLENVKGFLKAADLKEVKEIVLIHLSGDNSDPKEFKNEIERTTGKEVYIAKKGLEVDLSIF